MTRILTVVAVLSLLLTGCVSRQDAAGAQEAPALVPLTELADLTLQVGDQKGGTEALLHAAGMLDDLPYRIAFSTFTSGPPQIEAATPGKIDFAVTGNTPPIFGAAANARVKVVSAYDGSGRGDKILVHADSPLRAVTDLAGKRVAIAKGSSAHGNVLAQLHRAGLSTSDVQLVFLQPADALGAFTQRQVDAWAVWDPYTAQAEADIAVRSIAEATGVTNGAGFGVASDQALADPKRNTAISDLLVRYAKAAQWARDHPDEWARSYAASVGLSPEVAAAAQGRSLRLPFALSDELVASEQELADLFADSGQIAAAPEFAKWVDRRFAETLAPLYLDRS
ncbi:ABC transporter substrate-binding protein [Mycolicibacterium vaccae]|uniref:Putative aliphatic sulfonates-binding protein n=1 Tax=Mycolicibacterium vaccae ATCC 25954 TaxID=1194972 RepID=K0V856_MYCVA|nr:ABC transporter substrate-binding protein [Mycolicibacterium vaccae]ANI40455.1 ABC transporter substrate-binding protein [Mycolicibacterium vaccae 95051]EJZ07234.1 ABC transporter, substrate-binding protein, aliphatic sulfonates family [Mycolicibacterium vaccae ATCC 25954]MCV7062620.1 ABC transporter substrate-binding protein [Mycolicibacterium vaccae]